MAYEYIYSHEVSNDFKLLTDELDNELSYKNGEKQNEYNKYNKLDGINDTIIVYNKNVPIACGSIKLYDPNKYEVKRVYVRKDHRGKGISKEIMNCLESIARDKAIKTLILETSRTFIEAINLYKRMGYQVIDNYGQYKGM
jgi:GNAT superfamily N-acetyltransferase